MKLWIPVVFLLLSACAGDRPEPMTSESETLGSESFDNFDDDDSNSFTGDSSAVGGKASVDVVQGLTNGSVVVGQGFELRAVFSVRTPEGETAVTENRWFKNGVRIPGAAATSYTINSALMGSAGLYTLNVVEMLEDGNEVIIYGTSSRVSVSSGLSDDPMEDDPDRITTESELCPNSTFCIEGSYRIEGRFFTTTGLPFRIRLFRDGRYCVLDEQLPGEGLISFPAYTDMQQGSRRIRWDTTTYENGKCDGI